MSRSEKDRSSNPSDAVAAHYDASAAHYHDMYDREHLRDCSKDYPANYFRLQLLLESFVQKGVRRVLEVGVGDATPLIALADAGLDVWGFDFSKQMVDAARGNMQRRGYDPSRIFWGDVQDRTTYAGSLTEGPFDGVLAMGVMPHVVNDDGAIENIAALVRPEGSIFIEFRNKLFSLFSFNRYTADFILNDLLDGVAADVKQLVADDLQGRLRMDVPAAPPRVPNAAPRDTEIFSKFHTPFEVTDLLERHGFADVMFRWYHYHPAMPYLSERAPQRFRDEAIGLERETSGWRGMFLCSAFVAEATKRA